MRFQKTLVFVLGLGVGVAIFWLSSSQSSAAPVCFNDLGRRNTAGQVSNTYPRQGTSVASSFFCGQVSNPQQWVLLSSYYHNGSGAPGSTLHTPNAQFRVFSNGRPTSAVTVRIERSSIGRCNYTSGLDVGIYRLGPSTAYLGSLDGQYFIDLSIPASDFIRDSKYGQTAWVWNHTLQASANNSTSVHCRIRTTSFTPNSYITLIEDTAPQNGYSESFQKFNQNNAGTGAGAKRPLGPVGSTGNTAIALYADIDNAVLEYAIPIQLDCNAAAGRYHLRFYDPDSPSFFNPPGTTQPAGAAGLAIYRDSDGALLYDNPNVTQSNDEYGEILMPDMVPNVRYTMVWYNITARNGIQFWMPFSEATRIPGNTCPTTSVGPHMSCTFDGIPTVNPSSVVEVFVTIKNESVAGWAGGTSTELGIVDPANGYATVNGLATNFNWASPGVGQGPPDHNSATYIDNSNGLGTTWRSESYSKAGPTPPTPVDATVERYFLNSGINTGASVEYSIKIIAPSSNNASKTYGVRLIDRPPQEILGGTGYAWMDWAPSCLFTIRTFDVNAAVLTCGNLLYTPVDPEPGESISFSTSVQNSSPAGSTSLSGYTMQISTPLNTANYGYTPNPVPPGAIATSNQVTIPGGLPAGDHNITWSFSNGTYSSGDCTQQINVRSKPYVRFYGNDVFAGGCAVSADNKTVASSRYGSSGSTTPNYDNFRGSASELALFAAGQIDGVLAGSQRNRGTSLIELSFANNNSTYIINNQERLYGGGFGGTYCNYDYFGNKTIVSSVAQSIVNLASLSSGTYFYRPSGNTYVEFIVPVNQRISNRLVIYVDGDAVIGGGSTINPIIGYADGPWANVDSIPSLYLITSGDIYIDDNVERLDGNYIAQPRSGGGGGEIHTCSLYNFGVNLIEPTVDSAEIATFCNRKLTVNGAFIANRVNLLRSIGTVRNSVSYESSSSAGIAEVFNFSPETYLVNGGGMPPLNSSQSIDSIISLPPSF